MIIGITGLISSGKNTAADVLVAYGFESISFADSLKDAVSSIFGWDREMLQGSTNESREWREQIDEWWSKKLSIPNLTPRWVLQNIGTELFRNKFHNDIWVASVENKLRNINKNVVIPDVRFSNEIDTIKNVGGIVIRVFRGENPDWYNTAIEYNTTHDEEVMRECKHTLEYIFRVHASEYASVGFEYDYIIENNSTLQDLHLKLRNIVDTSQLVNPHVSN